MENLSEILFKEVCKVNILEFLDQIWESGNTPTLVSCSGTESFVELYSPSILQIKERWDKGYAIYFTLKNFDFLGLKLPWLNLDISDVDVGYELSLTIEEIDLWKATSVEALRDWVSTLANRLDVVEYFAGIMPAIDEDTCYFNKEGIPSVYTKIQHVSREIEGWSARNDR